MSKFKFLVQIFPFKMLIWTLLYIRVHTELTRVSSIRFLEYEIKRVFIFNSIIIYFTDLFILFIFIQNAYANKKVFKKKG